MFHSHLFNLDFDRSISMFVDRITKNIIQEDLKDLGNYPFKVKSYSCCGRLECRGCHKLCPHTPRCSCPLHSAELHNSSLLSEGTLRPFSPFRPLSYCFNRPWFRFNTSNNYYWSRVLFLQSTAPMLYLYSWSNCHISDPIPKVVGNHVLYSFILNVWIWEETDFKNCKKNLSQ